MKETQKTLKWPCVCSICHVEFSTADILSEHMVASHHSSGEERLNPDISYFQKDHYEGAENLLYFSTPRNLADPDSSSKDELSSKKNYDEIRARNLKLPFEFEDIIHLPIENYNKLISKFNLNKEQLFLCQGIRRRGKNKISAQKCRKRKMDKISKLDEEVKEVRQKKQALLIERENLNKHCNEMAQKLNDLEATVLRGLNKNVNDYFIEYLEASVSVKLKNKQLCKD